MFKNSDEFRRVLDALETMEDDANCYRLIGGSLVQYQVVAIRPILSTNLAGVNFTFPCLIREEIFLS